MQRMMGIGQDVRVNRSTAGQNAMPGRDRLVQVEKADHFPNEVVVRAWWCVDTSGRAKQKIPTAQRRRPL